MIVPIKRFLQEKAQVYVCIIKTWQISLSLHYTDKIRNLPRGIDLQIWMQIVQMFLERNTPLEA